MADIKGLLKDIEDYKRKYTITENSSEAEKLVARIQAKKYSKEEFFEVEKDVIAFLKSDASEEDKQTVCGYTESLHMICSAIREGQLEI